MGKSKSRDYGVSVYLRQFAMDAFFQQYRGFYVADSANAAGIFTQLPDSRSEHYGTQLYYIFSPESYNMSAAFSKNMRQDVSGGSWVVSTYLQKFKYLTGNTLGGNPDSVAANSFSSLEVKSLNGGLAGGYGYSWLFAENWYLSGQFLFGLGYQSRRFYTAGVVSEGEGLGTKTTFHFGLGWNSLRHCIAMKGTGDAIYLSHEGDFLTSQAIMADLFYLYRFDL